MRSFIESVAIAAACGSAIFWFASVMCHLPNSKPGTDDLQKINEQSAEAVTRQGVNFSVTYVKCYLMTRVRFPSPAPITSVT